jgi:hypothetical protein
MTEKDKNCDSTPIRKEFQRPSYQKKKKKNFKGSLFSFTHFFSLIIEAQT